MQERASEEPAAAAAEASEAGGHEMPIGAAAVPDTGTAADAPPVSAAFERMGAMLTGAETRLKLAFEEFKSLQKTTPPPAIGGDEPASGGAASSGGAPGDPEFWKAGFQYQDLLAYTQSLC